MKIDKTYLQDIVEKYDLAAVAEEMERRLDIPTAKLGFIGAFSSGKGSLLNALLDTKQLPVDIKPKTKAICIVEPIAGLESPLFFRDTDEGREKIDCMTFNDIVNGESSGDAVIQLPANDAAFAGMVFVDTPGVDTPWGRSESERTYSYLALMDAAVVCISVEDGTIKEEVSKFICSPMLRPLGDNLVFVLTKGDLKSSTEKEAIKKEVIEKLEALCTAGKLHVRNVAERVVTVSRETAKEVLLPFLQKHCFSHLPELLAAREQKELKALASDVAVILRTRANALTFDAAQYEEAIDKAKRKREQLEDEATQRKEVFKDLEGQLQERVSNTIMSHKLEVTGATDDQKRRAAIGKMLEEVRAVVEKFAKAQEVSRFMPGPGIAGAFSASLDQSIKKVECVRDLAVMVPTALAAAWIGPAETRVGNACEAAGGAIIQKILQESSPVARFINPLEIVANIVADKFKSDRFDILALQASRRIAKQVLSDLSAPYQRKFLAPLRRRLEEVERGLSAQRAARNEAAEKTVEKEREMLERAAELADFAVAAV